MSISNGSTNRLGKIVQISSMQFHDIEKNRNVILIYALTDAGRAFEYLTGYWVELNPLTEDNIRVFNQDTNSLVKKNTTIKRIER